MTSVSDLYSLYLQHPVVTTDSRTCPAGSIFFALKGDSFDGNQFAGKALQAGCAYAVIDDPGVKTGNRMLLTDSVLLTLQQLARLHRETLGLPIIGITGTNGKTTTRELLAAVLSVKYSVLSTQGNLNNHIGVPLTLLRLTRRHEMGVVEMGANHPGEIGDLSQIVRPDYGLITNVGCAHLEGFGSLEGVIRAKGELYDFLRKTNGKIFIHRENPHLQAIACGLEQITYGTGDDAYVTGKVTDCYPFLRFQWTARQGVSHTVDTRLAGDYNLWNVLAAVAAGQYFNIPPESINAAIAACEPATHRSQWKKTARNELIVDAYNANPDSMQAALTNFATLPVCPKAVILGDMHELGINSPTFHEAVVKQLQTFNFEQVILCGRQFAAVASLRYPCFPDTEALTGYLTRNPWQGYHILIKGSHAVHLEKVTDRL
ncbi:MAG: UDP-N-acetylmuramoyl-tripeptide--D-alanyl-D-alanine ligase [Tannerella sp.]|jgi:UDP-N-acetylmuramoyl-tripeptide--D-alanyl-D-alanine ligase|nr:UDP-N-acetylmuramoyl-tripeptide--D-alanyl-D-alanine ligase [Tannerella sp.]